MSSPNDHSTRQTRFGFLKTSYLSVPLSLFTGYIGAAFAGRFLVPQSFRTPPYHEAICLAIMVVIVLVWHIYLWPLGFRSISPRFRRFSIRTLLCGITLIAIFSATIGSYLVRLQVERSVVAKLNGTASFERNQVRKLEIQPAGLGEGPRIDDALSQLKKLSGIRSLNLQHAWVTDDGLVHLKSIRTLEELYLGFTYHLEPGTDLVPILLGRNWMGSDVTTPRGVRRIQTDLWSHSLSIRNIQITDAGMEHVGAISSLRVLSLENTAVADEGLRRLQKLSNLEEIDLRMTYVTDDGIGWLTKLPQLKRLKLSNARFISDGSLQYIRQIGQLRELSLSPGVTDVGLQQLADLPNLRVLDISQCTVTDAAVEELRAKIPKCQITR